MWLHDFSKSCNPQVFAFALDGRIKARLCITVRTVCAGQAGACAASEVPANSGRELGAFLDAVRTARRVVAPAYCCSFLHLPTSGAWDSSQQCFPLEGGANAAVTRGFWMLSLFRTAQQTVVHELPPGPCKQQRSTTCNLQDIAWPDPRHQRLVSDVSRRRNSSGLPRLSRRCRSCPAGVLSSGAACVTTHEGHTSNMTRGRVSGCHRLKELLYSAPAGTVRSQLAGLG